MLVCQIKNQTSETAVDPHSTPPNPGSPTDPWLFFQRAEDHQEGLEAQQNMSDFIPPWSLFAQFWLCFVWLLLLRPTRNMKTTISDIFLPRISSLSPPPMDWRWTITQQRGGPSRSNPWSWVYGCTGSLKTASDIAPCAVTKATRKGTTQETRNCACTGTLWQSRPVRRSAGSISLRCSFLPPAERSCRTLAKDLRTDICTMRIPRWDV